jgi:hypothetical protein
MEGPVKFVVISRLAPGVENSRKALEVFLKAGLPQGTETTYAASDGKTFINIVESDAPDMVAASTYAPFFDKSEVFQVVAVDETWLHAIQAAQANWDLPEHPRLSPRERATTIKLVPLAPGRDNAQRRRTVAELSREPARRAA